jgi:hypothetical protein
MKKSFVLLFLYLSCQAIFAQSDSTLRYKKKIKTLAITSAIGYVGAYATLGYFWYSNQTTSNFHFFNDNQEWMQMDKFGHALGAFAISETAVQTLRNIGMERKSHTYRKFIRTCNPNTYRNTGWIFSKLWRLMG